MSSTKPPASIPIDQLRAEHEALTEVYAIAARMRQFPVPFDVHFELIGAVDRCRSVLDPPIDHSAARPSSWQAYVAAYPREEFLAASRTAHATLRYLWSAAIGKEDYDKAAWRALEDALARFVRTAAEKIGIVQRDDLSMVYSREEFLAAFRETHATLHHLWSADVGKDGYDKAAWRAIDNALARFARDAAETVGVGRTEPLL